jgi:hypothetical protein
LKRSGIKTFFGQTRFRFQDRIEPLTPQAILLGTIAPHKNPGEKGQYHGIERPELAQLRAPDINLHPRRGTTRKKLTDYR